MNDESDSYIIIFIIIAFIFELLFAVSYYNLYKFKKCYDNDFTLKYCHKYKNY